MEMLTADRQTDRLMRRRLLRFSRRMLSSATVVLRYLHQDPVAAGRRGDDSVSRPPPPAGCNLCRIYHCGAADPSRVSRYPHGLAVASRYVRPTSAAYQTFSSA